MKAMIRELDYQQTPLGELILRCRRSPRVPDELVYEVKLGEEMLMSSSVNGSERALADMTLARCSARPCDVLIGGLGLGYTALAALAYPWVRRVDVVELLAPVIAWHRARLVPAAERLLADPRCTFVEADFFEHGASPRADDSEYDAILIDIDHSPTCWLHARHAEFYTASRLASLATHLRPQGVFGLWSADEPPGEFISLLEGQFQSVRADAVQFENPHIGRTDTNWIISGQRHESA